jgi:thymidylate synthase
MRILAVVSGAYGTRHLENINKHKPDSWTIEIWQTPAAFPLVIDYPEDYLPQELPQVDLILSLAEHKGAAELLPDMAQMTGAKAVIAAIDSEAWLPRGLARQLLGWLEKISVACALPKPLCSLTETDYLAARRKRVPHNSPLIAEFARFFGQPDLKFQVDPQSCKIVSVAVERDAACGCARFAASGLIGLSADEAEEKAGLLHHHFPCMASMGIDRDFGDTLMHISGNLLKDNVDEQVKPYKHIQYLRPGSASEEQNL